jgi:hypothetical protein
MHKIVGWIKNNKFQSLLIVVVAISMLDDLSGMVARQMVSGALTETYKSVNNSAMMVEDYAGESYSAGRNYAPTYEVAPQPDIQDRMVIENSHLSLLVKDVTSSMETIKDQVSSIGGYVLNEYINRQPEYGDESATMTVRIPTDKVDTFKEYVRGTSVKVVSENISGTDITDQYVDIDQRIARLQKTMSKFEAILDAATDIDDILRVTREINNLQAQIDSYKGQQRYMEGASSTSKISLSLSTDELSLPYAPAKSWRPEVIFKKAVRSMLGTLQSLGSAGIWLVVYLPLIAVAVLVVKAFMIVIRKKQDRQ